MTISEETYEVLSTVNDNLDFLRHILKDGKIHEALDIIDGMEEENNKLMSE